MARLVLLRCCFVSPCEPLEDISLHAREVFQLDSDVMLVMLWIFFVMACTSGAVGMGTAWVR